MNKKPWEITWRSPSLLFLWDCIQFSNKPRKKAGKLEYSRNSLKLTGQILERRALWSATLCIAKYMQLSTILMSVIIMNSFPNGGTSTSEHSWQHGSPRITQPKRRPLLASAVFSVMCLQLGLWIRAGKGGLPKGCVNSDSNFQSQMARLLGDIHWLYIGSY